jgi:hypothetical protein
MRLLLVMVVSIIADPIVLHRLPVNSNAQLDCVGALAVLKRSSSDDELVQFSRDLRRVEWLKDGVVIASYQQVSNNITLH